jgi:dienelactone hydrolase
MRRMKLVMLCALTLAFAVTTAHAKIKTMPVQYKQGGAVLEGYLAYDDAAAGKRPGVLVVHAWMGIDANAKQRAEMLAGLGYVAFVADIYGKGVRPANRDEASKQASIYKKNRPLMRQRVNAGLKTMLGLKQVDASKTAAIGYCFGGTTVLELARSGAKVGGVVSFHGGLDSPAPADGKNIKAKVLVLHGASDQGISATDKAAFEKELTDAKVDWQLVEYGGAVHCFTHKDAGNDPSKGCAYDANADARSWNAMKTFFDEIFAARK